LKPDFAEAYANLGAAYEDQGQVNEAIGFFSRALELKPDFAGAHLNLAMASLLIGNYERGWSEYEWRLECNEFPDRTLKKKRRGAAHPSPKEQYCFTPSRDSEIRCNSFATRRW